MFSLFKAVRNARPFLVARCKTERGAVATEYGLLIALVALAIIIALGALAAALVAVFSDSASTLEGAT